MLLQTVQTVKIRLSRITDFNVQISVVNIHSHCSKMVGRKYRFNLTLCYFS